MPDKWSQYEVPAQQGAPAADKWSQYEVTPTQQVAPQQPMLQRALSAAGDFGTGLLKGAASTSSNLQKIPYLGAALTAPPVLTGQSRAASQKQLSDYSQTHGMMQGLGKGVEQVAEFMVPGGAEEGLAAKAAEFAPRLAPLAKMVASAGASGLVNKAQGGDFKTGAIAGAGGSAIGQGLKAIAPHIAESALNIRKLDRAYGKSGGSIGRSILDETKGFSPSAVAESAQGKLNELNPKLNHIADAASTRPRGRIAGLLPAPPTEIPLGEAPLPPEMPGGLFDAQPFPATNVGEARVIRNPKGQILPKADRNVEFPAERPPTRISPIRAQGGKYVSSEGMTPEGPNERPLLPIGRNPNNGQMLSRQPTRKAFMAGAGGEAPGAPEFSGPGVLLRYPEAGRGPIPTTEPNASASLGPARNVLRRAFDTAGRQGERSTVSQLTPLSEHLGESISGSPILENVTPRQLLDLKRGFGNEHIHRWNPETMQGVKGTAAQTYHALGQEFNRAVPGAQELNGRISKLIPVAKRAESAELGAPTAQRIFNRVGAHTGALAGSIFGGYQGYERGGVPGALGGALAGAVLPEMLASPTGEMAIARTLNRAKSLRPLTGALLNIPRMGDRGTD